jgi:hypothetical protein
MSLPPNSFLQPLRQHASRSAVLDAGRLHWSERTPEGASFPKPFSSHRNRCWHEGRKSSEENPGRSKEAHANDLCCRLEAPPADGSFSANGGTNGNANNCTQYDDADGGLLDFFLKIFANLRNQEDKSGCCTVMAPRAKSSHPLPTRASSSAEEDQTQSPPTLKFLRTLRLNYIREVCVPLRGNSPQDRRTSGYLGYTIDHPRPSPHR